MIAKTVQVFQYLLYGFANGLHLFVVELWFVEKWSFGQKEYD
jgi:hypothetical protein